MGSILGTPKITNIYLEDLLRKVRVVVNDNDEELVIDVKLVKL